MQLKLSKYLFELRKNAKVFERTDINGIPDKSFWGRYLRRVSCSLVSILILYCIKDGFTQNFVSYASSVLSILIGLFITAIIFSFDRFYEKENIDERIFKVTISKEIAPIIEKEYNISTKEISQETSKKKIWSTQSHNYSKQFAFITGYNIVLCIFAIVLLSFSTLFDNLMSIDFFKYSFTSQVNGNTIENFLIACFVIFQRFFVLYWMASVMFNTLFIVSSMVNFMTVKIDREQ